MEMAVLMVQAMAVLLQIRLVVSNLQMQMITDTELMKINLAKTVLQAVKNLMKKLSL